MGNIFLEIGIHAPSKFKKIDECFKELKLKNKSQQHKVIIKLENVLEDIFGTVFEIDLQKIGSYVDNCAVLPQFKKVGKISYKNNIEQLGHIKKMIMILGVDLIKGSTPRELTAILLHEVGHIVNHTSNTIGIISKIISNISIVTDPLSRVPIIGGVLLPIFIFTTRTMHWTEHIGEYNADKFPVQHGYGDELVSVIHKWNLQYQRDKNKQTFIQKVGMLKDIILGTTHPKDTKRIQRIVESIKLNYSKKYKSKKLNKILDYYSLR